MTQHDEKTFRRMVGSYLSHPDPEAWLVAADYLEDHDDGRATLWRDRGLYYPMLSRLFDEVAGLSHEERDRTRETPLGQVILSLYRQRTRVEILVLLPNRCQLQGFHVLTRAMTSRGYHTARLLSIIDKHGHRFKAS